MIKNYFNTAFRNLVRNKFVSVLSLFGLAIGLAAGFLSYLHIQYELSYDGYHSKSDRIYRIVTGEMAGGKGWVGISAPIPPKMKSDIPEIEDFVRLTKLRRSGKVVVHHDNQYFNEEHFFLADQSLFSIYDIPFIYGDASSALNSPDGIVISETQSLKLFGDQMPLDELVTINEEFEFKVTGVIEDIPHNSHMDLDYIVSFENLETMLPGRSLTGNWGQYNYYAYALLRDGADPGVVNSKIQSISVPLRDYTHSFEQINLQPLGDIHFVENRGNLKPSYDTRYLYIYAAAALGLILISLVNFINLKTAGSSRRVKEVGVRKAIGASQTHLQLQFILEAFLLCALALTAGVALLKFWMIPFFNHVMESNLTFEVFNLQNIGFAIVFVALLSVLSGGYVAFFVTSFSPVKALKSQVKTGSGRQIRVRDILLGAQFVITILLMASSFIVSRQMSHISDMNIGLNPDQVLHVPLYGGVEQDKANLIRTELNKIPNVHEASISGFVPGEVNWNQTVWWEGQLESESMYIISIDPEFLSTLDIELLEGDIERLGSGDGNGSRYILNRSALNHLGWDTGLGKMFSAFGESRKRPVDGVIEDFHYQSIHTEIKPCVLVISDLDLTQLHLKISTGDISTTITSVQEKLSSLLPNMPFEYGFLDEGFASLYKTEQQAKRIISWYTIICILLAVFGLYGLLTFEVTERTKEIAVRRVLGADTKGILALLSGNFIRLILVALVIASPIAYYLMHQWLQSFAYRIGIAWWIFLMVGLSVTALTMIAIGAQCSRAMLTNPIDSLRSE